MDQIGKIRLKWLFAATVTAAFLSLLPSSSYADTVSGERAKKVAVNFFASKGYTTSPSSLQILSEGNPCTAATRSSVEPSYYIFNRDGGGFVIVSGEDAFPPVLAYSKNSSFTPDDYPDNLQWWLRTMEESIILSRGKSAVATEKINDEWTALEYPTRGGQADDEDYGKLITTPEWGQKEPYNKYCPALEDGTLPPSGCGPTAMSIAMYILKCPKEAVKAVGSATVTFNWDKMLTSYKGDYTEEEADAVARLMAENGRRAGAQYGKDGTSTYSHILAPTFMEYSYEDGTSVFDQSVQYRHRSDYSSDVWMGMIKDEIRDGRVLIYTGQSTEGGHAFILDGYDAEGNVHVNWGWTGSNNGYYNIYSMDYSEEQDATFNLKPNAGGSHKVELVLDNNGDDTVKGLSSETTIFEAGTEFTLSYKWIINYEEHLPFDGQIIVAHLDADDSLVEFISDPKDLYLAGWRTNGNSIKCKIGVEPELGHKARLYYRQDTSGEWEEMPYNHESTTFSPSLPLYDISVISRTTSLDYSPVTKILTITTKAGVTVSMKGSDESQVALEESKTDNGSVFTVDASSLKGEYTLSLTKRREAASLKINFTSENK